MPILLTCGCGKKLKVGDHLAGQQGLCPACGQTLTIPSSDHDAPPAPPRAVPPPLPTVQQYPQEESAPVDVTIPAGQEAQPLTNHGGGPLERDADFFVPPPAEIGELLSAHTTMRQGDEPWSAGARASWALLGAGIGVFIGVLIDLIARIRNPGAMLILPLALGGIGVAIALWATGFKRRCSYIGREGVARFTCTGSRRNITRAELFLFRDATELRIAQTRHYTNGVYQNTAYGFTWTDVSGLTRYVISGSHGSEQGNPPLTHAYHYAASAEIAWTMHLLSQLEAQLTLGQGITFKINKHEWVRVSPGHLRFSFKGQTFDCPVEEIGMARVDQGMFIIKRIDAREGWFSSEGVFKFPYNQLANAQLFLILLDKVAGVRLN
ncbi:MAG: hypothetical protein L0Z62_48420 [Gemmataceae bacterium]|nr:hypothetical protein [Gemmataceae bacterium]